MNVVNLFHEYLNAGKIDSVLELVTDHVTIGGPRGQGVSGKHVVEEWFGRAQITMKPLRWFAREDIIIVEQDATWHTENNPEPVRVATVFTITNNLISGIVRHGDVIEALASSGLDETDHVDDRMSR